MMHFTTQVNTAIQSVENMRKTVKESTIPTGAAEVSTVETRPASVSLELHHEIAQFLYHEANLLDDWKFRDWLDLLGEDIHYAAVQRKRSLAVGQQLYALVALPLIQCQQNHFLR